MRRLVGSALSVVASVWVLSCGDDGSDPKPGDEGDDTVTPAEDGSFGTTSCGAQNCEAGQYCYNMLCVNGCLSDKNCATNQTCEAIDPETHVGACQNRAAQPTKDCNAFCSKAQACFLQGNDVNPTNCMQACTAASAACVSCVNDSNCGQGCEGACGGGFGG